jgi:archaellum biogenesis ATPase FlaH
MLKRESDNFLNVLFTGNKVIKANDSFKKNISEQLLTIRTLVFIAAHKQEIEENVQLGKILSACRLSQEDYFIVRELSDWHTFRENEQIREVLLFGVKESDLDITIQFTENQINKFDDRIWIKTKSISELISNQQLKNDLWQNALKPHFASL